MSWAEIKKAVNDNLTVPLNRQCQIPRMVVYINNATFVAPRSTWYSITAVGAGGPGGAGLTQKGVPQNKGGGGGGGAVSASKLYFEKGMSVRITIDSNGTAFGSFMSAGAGGAGVDRNSTGGTGGVAVGGNLFNINGNDGSGTNGGSAGLTTVAGYGINGAGSGYLPIPNPSNISTCGTTTTSPTLGGGNAGGKTTGAYGVVGTGGAGFGGGGSGGQGGVTSDVNGRGYAYGGSGGSGAVFIEYFDEFTETNDTTALNHTFLKGSNSLTMPPYGAPDATPDGSKTINVTFSGNILSVVVNVVNTEINCEYSYEGTTLTIVLTNRTAEIINANYSYSAIIEGTGATIIT